MAIEDHPHYRDWSDAFHHLQEAHDHLRSEIARGANGSVELAKKDLERALQAYDKITDLL
ncbi:hypothetical protein GOB10_25850 [Sinorhizobium meliloti]|nr:hypothetical protein [Sinorhizobium meliloti]